MIQLLVCNRTETHLLWEELSEESIGIFIGSFFPRMVGMSKVHSHLGSPFNTSVESEFSSVVVGNGLSFVLWNILEYLSGFVVHRLRVFVFNQTS